MNAAETAPTHADVAAARGVVAARLAPTPLIAAHGLAHRIAGDLWLKCESFQPTGSFKPRGALNWLARASADECAAGLVTVSAGNHATALAWAARAKKLPVTVVMPANASRLKTEAARALGATVELIGGIDDAWGRAHELAADGLTLVPPYDDPRIIAGAGTVGLEILEQSPVVPDVVACCVGGGGLISGLGLALKQAHPDLRLVGVEPTNAPTLTRSWAAGGPVTLESTDTVAAALGANRAGRWTHAVSRAVVDELVTLDEDEIVGGTLATLMEGRLYAEPGGAIAVAALLAGKIPVAEHETAVAVVTGANMDRSLLQRML